MYPPSLTSLPTFLLSFSLISSLQVIQAVAITLAKLSVEVKYLQLLEKSDLLGRLLEKLLILVEICAYSMKQINSSKKKKQGAKASKMFGGDDEWGSTKSHSSDNSGPVGSNGVVVVNASSGASVGASAGASGVNSRSGGGGGGGGYVLSRAGSGQFSAAPSRPPSPPHNDDEPPTARFIAHSLGGYIAIARTCQQYKIFLTHFYNITLHLLLWLLLLLMMISNPSLNITHSLGIMLDKATVAVVRECACTAITRVALSLGTSLAKNLREQLAKLFTDFLGCDDYSVISNTITGIRSLGDRGLCEEELLTNLLFQRVAHIVSAYGSDLSLVRNCCAVLWVFSYNKASHQGLATKQVR